MQPVEDQYSCEAAESQSSPISSPNGGINCPLLAEIVSAWPDLDQESRNVLRRVAESLKEGGGE